MHRCNFILVFSFLVTIVVDSFQPQPTLVLIDGFTEYLSGYCRHYCEEKNIRLIEIVSPYICGLFKSKGNEIPSNLHAPIETPDIIAWAMENEIISDNDHSNDHICVLSESDSGVSTAEKIAHVLQCRGNGLSPHLRNKYESNIKCQQYGLETVKQQLVSTVDDAISFARDLWEGNTVESDGSINPFDIVDRVRKCVVKPYRGVASDGVFLCETYDEIKHAINSLINKPKYGGGLNEAVVIQEYADGQEYAVDTVALDGEIKVVALWKYHKKPVNNAPFVYQCTELIPVATEIERSVCEYCINVLRAQGLKWGPTHTEIKYTSNGPRLIEINARWHAQHFPPITRSCLGNDAVELTLDTYFNPESFYDLPVFPEELHGYGRILHLISYFSGQIKSINHLDEINQLNSTILLNIESSVGDTIVKTVDIRTDCGYVLLYNEDFETLENDYNHILSLQNTLFTLYNENEKHEISQNNNEINEIDIINQNYRNSEIGVNNINNYIKNYKILLNNYINILNNNMKISLLNSINNFKNLQVLLSDNIKIILQRFLVILLGSYVISHIIIQIIPLFDSFLIN